MRIDGNGGSDVNYYPNSYSNLKPNKNATEHPITLHGTSGRTEYPKQNDFEQAGLLYQVNPALKEQQRELREHHGQPIPAELTEGTVGGATTEKHGE